MLKKMAFLPYAATEETFFKSLAGYFPQSDPRYIMIQRAYQVAEDAFRTKKRDGGEDYFGHLRAVALILVVHLRRRDHFLIVAALLHDIVEDYFPVWTIDRIRLEFGPEVALLVDWLTKAPVEQFKGSKEERDHAYHSRFRNAPREFFFIKLADRLHNLITLGACTEEKCRRKVEETERYYLPYAEEHLILLHELEEALEAAKKVPAAKAK